MLYEPLLKELALPKNAISNAVKSALQEAIQSGKVKYYRGVFSGKFSAELTREMKSFGAVWDKSGVFKILARDLPPDIRREIEASESVFLRRLESIDTLLSKTLPEEISRRLKTADLFDRALWKTDKDLSKTIDKLTIQLRLSDNARARISDEWQTNMDLWIQNFSEEQILDLRKKIKKSVVAGNRYGSMISTIQDSYDVTEKKAKFLARQETKLLVTKLKETRYTEAGIPSYRWKCVKGTALHPVRPSHKILDGTVHRWDAPPVTTEPGEPARRNNPGQDYNCRCVAIPVIRTKW